MDDQFCTAVKDKILHNSLLAHNLHRKQENIALSVFYPSDQPVQGSFRSAEGKVQGCFAARTH